MRIAVAGGTGVVGTPLVATLESRGHEVLTLSRSSGVDLTDGTGLTDRLAGVETVIDVLSTATSSKKAAVKFFSTTTLNLLTAEEAAGVRHHVALSIVGIDGTPFGYYEGKSAQEQVIKSGRIPYTIVRAPQFHEFAEQLIERTSLGPVTVVPRMRSAPMAAAEVAAVLADIAVGEPRGRAGDLHGPEVAEMPDLVRRVLEHRGTRRRVLSLRLPGSAGRRMAEGALVAEDPEVIGTQTFDQWLAAR